MKQPSGSAAAALSPIAGTSCKTRSHIARCTSCSTRSPEELEEFADEIAKRTVQLGGVAQGTIQVVTKQSCLAAYPLNLASGKDHFAALSKALAKFGTSARAAIDEASESGDADTGDLFTEVSRGVDKLLWLVEAHLQAKD
jgi:starvation-inducible DNA-binding protein